MEENQRALLGKQPVHILMFDLSSPFNTDAGNDVCDTLENLFSIACNLSGPSRIPFFSLMVMHSHPEILLPFSYVRNNYQRIQTALSELRSLLEGYTVTENLQSPCYYQGLAEACSQYRRQLHSSVQSGICHQLEVLIVTCQKSNIVQTHIENAMATLDTDNLKRIQVLCLTDTSVLCLDDITNSPSSSTSEHSSNNSAASTGLVEVINLETDILCLQNFFSGWLIDSSTDSEHLQLLLPPLLDSNLPLTVKCDLHERILQPAQLPFYSQFTVHWDSSVMKMVFPSTSKAIGMCVPVYKLQVTRLVPVAGVCDSLVFGMPIIAQPTSCWKIDWDDLEKNRQLFKAFCHTLSVKEQAAVAYLLPCENVPKTKGSNHPCIKPLGHFLLVPSNNGTLLVKSIAVQELLLPFSAGNQEEEVSQDFVDIISESLDQLEISESYNPLNYTSNLYESLKNIEKKPVTQRQQKRPLDDSTPAYTNKVVSTKSGKQTKKAVVAEKPALFDNEPADTPLSTKSGKQTKKAVLAEKPALFDNEPADTPLGKRLLNKNALRNPRRTLYTESHSKFLPGDTLLEQSENIQTFKSGRLGRVKPQLPFPTSL